MADWRTNISFSERFANIFKVQDALDIASAGEHGSHTHSQAKDIETIAFKEATSHPQYEQIIEDQIDGYLSVSRRSSTLSEADAVNGQSLYSLPSGGVNIGRYTNAHHHKDGVSSSVFKARGLRDVIYEDEPNGNKALVALKVTHPSSCTAPHDPKRECRLLLTAKSGNVITLLETFEQAGGCLVLVFPFMPYDLGQLLQDLRLSECQRKTCLQDIFRGLAHIHQLGIIHRDIKPGNILLQTPTGPAFIADFGIAWAKDDSSAEPADAKILDVGSTSYRPPELLFGNQRYCQSLDLWAAGCVAAQVINLGSRTLFDSGDLGSELALIKSIFQTLGTPHLDVWPEASQFPDWGKMTFHEYPARPWAEILPRVSEDARDLVKSLLRYESAERLSAKSALQHPYLS